MGAAAVSRAAQLVVVAVVARRLQPEDFGVFVFANGSAMIASLIGNLGWQMSFNRFFSVARHNRDWPMLRALMRFSSRVNYLGCGFAALMLAVASLFAGKLALGLLAGALLTIPSGTTLLRRQQLAGTGQAPFALLLDQGLASMILIVPVLLFRLSLFEIMAIFTGAMVLGNFIAGRLIARKLPPDLGDYEPKGELREWMTVSVNLLMARFARLLLSRLDVLLLPVLATIAQAGIYGAALRATYILTFPQFVLQTINGPQFADAFAAGSTRRARRVLALSMAFAVVTSVPPLLLFLILPRWTMTFLFGASYASGALALVLISIGQFAIGLGIPFSGIMSVAGSERALSRVNIAILVLALALSIVLVPRYGATGAGWVTAICGVALLTGQIVLSVGPLRERAPQDS
jgi:O-antigen/teichoic acid export membrane protein